MGKDGSPKIHTLEARKKRITWILAIGGLCMFFYFLGSWQNTSNVATVSDVSVQDACVAKSPEKHHVPASSSPALDFGAHHQIELKDSNAIQEIPPCDMQYSEYTPCQHPPRSRRFDRNMLKYRERHCPAKEELLLCLIPAPPNYKTPFKWPQSRNYAWFDNIPHKELSIEKAGQNWVHVEGNRFRFPGGGTMFPRGADAYIDEIGKLIPLTSGKIRTAIDTGCGVRKFRIFCHC